MQKIIIHLGLPKVASTFCQRRIFPFIENASYVHKDLSKPSLHLVRLLRGYLRKESIDLESFVDNSENYFKTILARQKVVLISDENLSMSSMDVWD